MTEMVNILKGFVLASGLCLASYAWAGDDIPVAGNSNKERVTDLKKQLSAIKKEVQNSEEIKALKLALDTKTDEMLKANPEATKILAELESLAPVKEVKEKPVKEKKVRKKKEKNAPAE